MRFFCFADAVAMQIEYFGNGSISSIRDITARLKAQKVLLVTGRQSFRASGAASALSGSLAALACRRFSDFEVNPRLDEALPGIDLLLQFQPDLVVAVGGGSVIDMGKLIAILSAQPQTDYRFIVENSAISRRGIPLVAIPTTAGAGSEATHFAVAYIGTKKFSLAHRFLLPDYVIIDPELTCAATPYQTAVSGMDALCQAVESYWSVHSTGQSRELASEAIAMIMTALEEAVLAGSRRARQAMARAANYAGRAINISQTTAPHALSYTLTSRYAIPHGHAVALVLGKFFLLHETTRGAVIDRRGTRFFSNILETLYTLLGCKDADSCARAWYRRMEVIGLETDFARLGISSQRDRALIVKSVNPERLKNHPIRLTRRLLTQVFE